MSTIKSSNEHLTLNADGSSKDIKFQANGVEKASIDSSGNLTVSGNLTSLGIDDNADATAITINSSEQVGIGNTSPNRTLSIKHASQAELGFKTGSVSNGALIYYNDSEDKLLLRAQESGDHIAFEAGGSTERFRITSDGRGLSQFTAKAWARFSGGTLHDSHNCSSITQSGNTGYYNITFANAMANANYAVGGMAHADRMLSYHSAPTTTNLYMWSYNAASSAESGDYQSVIVFGD